jgi:hypothetical protein
MQNARRRRSRDARHRAEVLVDGANVALGQALVDRPDHHLQLVAVEWGRETIGRLTCCAGRMRVIEIYARLEDLAKLIESAPARGQPCFCQESGSERPCAVNRCWQQGTEISSASQVSGGVDLYRLTEEWIPSRKVLGLRASRMAIIATAAGIDQIAAQSYKCRIFALDVKRHRCNFKASLES